MKKSRSFRITTDICSPDIKDVIMISSNDYEMMLSLYNIISKRYPEIFFGRMENNIVFDLRGGMKKHGYRIISFLISMYNIRLHINPSLSSCGVVEDLRKIPYYALKKCFVCGKKFSAPNERVAHPHVKNCYLKESKL